jgi:hypothetical protein
LPSSKIYCVSQKVNEEILELVNERGFWLVNDSMVMILTVKKNFKNISKINI